MARQAYARGLRQSAYRVLVASSPRALQHDNADVWDSGRVDSSTEIDIVCVCKALEPHTVYFWKVMIWDQDQRASGWSAEVHWQTGMLASAAWQAHWIAAGPDEQIYPPTREGKDLPESPVQSLPLFRHAFTVSKPIASATVAVSGLGQYELHLNGRNVTATVLNPGWTDYRKRILYQMYNVTALLKPGRNAFGAMLGNGMYNVPNVAGRYTKFTGRFGRPKLILQLIIRFKDGSETYVNTDKSWMSSPGPITFSSIYGGEDYDARCEKQGWDMADGKQDGWTAAVEVNGPGGVLVAQQAPPVVVAQDIRPVTRHHLSKGNVVYDLGTNFSGWPNVVVSGPAGSQVKLMAGELLDAGGHVTQASNNAHAGFENAFTYTLRGGGKEAWHPRFSYNGFRFVEVQRKPAPRDPPAGRVKSSGLPRIMAVSGSFLHDDVEQTGHFQSSDRLFNQIHGLIDQAILSNMVSVLTDCPTREKLGWLEQTHLAATSIMYNYDVLALYRKMADDMEDAQTSSGLVPSIAPEYVAFLDKQGQSTVFRDSPEWGSAMILSPLAAYEFYGDTSILEKHYSAMQRYLGYLATKINGGMIAYGLGDWYDIGPGAPGVSKLTGKSLTATAIYYQDLVAMAQIARVIERPADAASYTDSAAKLKTIFNRAIFHPATAQYDLGSQTADAMPLALGLVPEDRHKEVLDNLIADIRNHGFHITAGDIGFHYVVRALTENDRSEVLAAMLSRTDSPSYGYQLKRGATSLTEAWDANPTGSQNHFMLGHGEEWFYRGLAGIAIDFANPDPQRIRIRPALVDTVDAATASVHTVLGEVRSSWRRHASNVRFDVTIPAGQQATVVLPMLAGSKLTEGRRTIHVGGAFLALQQDSLSVRMVLGSGHYHFLRQ